jgi:hypothetical protein
MMGRAHTLSATPRRRRSLAHARMRRGRARAAPALARGSLQGGPVIKGELPFRAGSCKLEGAGRADRTIAAPCRARPCMVSLPKNDPQHQAMLAAARHVRGRPAQGGAGTP